MSRGDPEVSPASRRIGRYEVLGEIASGGMATVFLARSFGAKGFSRLVAIKRLHPHLEAEEDFVQMFLDEARLAARIRHPNVVATLDVEDADGLYIVMEYVEGVTLLMLSRAAAKANERTPVPVIIRVLLDTLAGLQAAHELTDDDGNLLGLVHRDVSPQNVLVGSDGTARLTDFGIAKAASRLTVTRDGQLKGKISYMAPEQTKRVEIDRRVDVFAMGIVAWELFTAKRLFAGDSDVEVLNHLLFEPIPTLLEHVSALPAIIDQVVMKALERDPTRRYGSAHEFADALERAAKMLGGPANHRAVAAFVQKVAGDRIARERGRIATGAPPATDGSTTGSFRARDGSGPVSTPSRVRTGTPSVRPNDPFGPPGASRPAASPLSPGRYNAPAAGSGPRKATGNADADRLDDARFERRSVVRAPTIAAPAGILRPPDPKPTIAGLGAPPVRPSAGPPSAQGQSLAPAGRPTKSTILGVGQAVPSFAPAAPSRAPGARPGRVPFAAPPSAKPHNLTFGANEFDEEMPTLAESLPPPGGRPAGVHRRSPEPTAAPPAEEIAFDAQGMESTIVDAAAARPVPTVAAPRRRQPTMAAAPIANLSVSPRKSTARPVPALADVIEQIPESFAESEPPSPPPGDTHESAVPAFAPPPLGRMPAHDPVDDGSLDALTPALGHTALLDDPMSATIAAATPVAPTLKPAGDTLPIPGLGPSPHEGAQPVAVLAAPVLPVFKAPPPAPRGPPVWFVVLLLFVLLGGGSAAVLWWYLGPSASPTPHAAPRPTASQPIHPPLLNPPAPRPIPPASVAQPPRPAPLPPSPAVSTPPRVAAPVPVPAPAPPAEKPHHGVHPHHGHHGSHVDPGDPYR